MKKVFLSAVMMIAFVGTSMANDIAEKEVEIADSKELVVDNVESVDSGEPVSGTRIKECLTVASAVRNKAIELKLSDSIVQELGFTAFGACLGAVK